MASAAAANSNLLVLFLKAKFSYFKHKSFLYLYTMYVLYGKVTQAKRWQKCQTFGILSWVCFILFTQWSITLPIRKSHQLTQRVHLLFVPFFFVFPSGICAMWIIVPTQLVLQMSSKSILHQDLTCIFKIPELTLYWELMTSLLKWTHISKYFAKISNFL